MSASRFTSMMPWAALLLALLLAAEGVAQGPPWGYLGNDVGPTWGRGGPGHMGRGGAGRMGVDLPTTINQLSALKTALALTPEQLPLWQTYENAVTAHARVREQMRYGRGFAMNPMDQQGLGMARQDTRTAMLQSWQALNQALTPDQRVKLANGPGACAGTGHPSTP